MAHPKPVLFVHDNETQIFEAHITLKQAVGANHDVHATGFYALYNLAGFLD